MLFDFNRRPTQSEIKRSKNKFLEQQGIKPTKHKINESENKFFLTVY